LEIGTHGESSKLQLYISAALKQNPLENASGQMLMVDVADVNAPDAAWTRAGALRSPAKMLEDCGTANLVQVHVADSLQFLKTTREQCDFCFLDGNHSARWIYNEVQLVRVRCAPAVLSCCTISFRTPSPSGKTQSRCPVFGWRSAASVEKDLPAT
jgi:hypothetical protein